VPLDTWPEATIVAEVTLTGLLGKHAQRLDQPPSGETRGSDPLPRRDQAPWRVFRPCSEDL